MTSSLAYSLYDAFSNRKYGGSQAAVVLDAASVDQSNRIAIAKELGYPATVFVSRIEGNRIDAQFYSTVAELPMCGHGTVGLMSCLSDRGLIDWQQLSELSLTLALPNGDANVIVSRTFNSETQSQDTLAMLEVSVADFRDDTIDVKRLCTALGVEINSIATDLPIETAVADFTHLIVPVRGLSDIQALQPNFADIVAFHTDYGIETITIVSMETKNHKATVRIRDFCPAVGVPESAAAGTTNAAVAGYLFRHKLITTRTDNTIELVAEQGIEMGRPSEIHSCLHVTGKRIESQWVGGVAAKVATGFLEVDLA